MTIFLTDSEHVHQVDPYTGFEAVALRYPEPDGKEPSDGSSGKAVERVDDLPKQFRERYGNPENLSTDEEKSDKALAIVGSLGAYFPRANI